MQPLCVAEHSKAWCSGLLDSITSCELSEGWQTPAFCICTLLEKISSNGKAVSSENLVCYYCPYGTPEFPRMLLQNCCSQLVSGHRETSVPYSRSFLYCVQVKSAFTRAYNKEAHLAPYSLQVVHKANRRAGSTVDEELEAEEIPSENEQDTIENDAMIKVTFFG